MSQPAQFLESPGADSRRENAATGAAPAPKPTLAVAATFTAEPLEETLRFWMRELALPGAVCFAPYNQVFQELVHPASVLSTNQRGLNVILLRFEDLDPRSPANAALAGAGVGALVERNSRDLLEALRAAVQRTAVPMLVCLCPPSHSALAASRWPGLLEHLENSWETELAGINDRLRLVKSSELFRLYPLREYDDPQAARLGHIPYTPAGYAGLGTFIARQFHALERTPKKVIALDCDQTLWAGVCGEDGPLGVRIDAPRAAFQSFMLRLQAAGILLCLCSKNNASDVAEVFRCRAEMPLKSGHFAARRLNWQSKSQNLRELAVELNLGLESFALVDDNPAECAEVEAHCPQVLTLLLPHDPADWPHFLEHIWAFDRCSATAEDQQRTTMYRQSQEREEFRAAAPSLADFIAGLNLEICIEPASAEQRDRISQLTQRTNQFNSAPKRRSAAEIANLERQEACQVLGVTVRDRFGDYGLSGVMIFNQVDGLLTVDAFLLSCRVLGKGVEHRMLAHLGQIARERGVHAIEVPFLPTSHNQPAWKFLNEVGAEFLRAAGDGHVFLYPTEIAAGVRFDPGKQTAPADSPEHVSERRTYEDARYAWIAHNARDPEQILKLVESRLGAQGVVRSAVMIAPESEAQRRLCELWRRVLRVEGVGIRDNFFELGGTSQLAVKMLAEWERTSGRRLSVAALFRAPTIEQLAALPETTEKVSQV